MNKILIFFSLVFGLFVTSCNSDDNDNSSSQIELSGTQKTTDSTRHFTFTSSTEYVYSESGNTYPGTYVFDGSKGVMSEPSSSFELEFKVNNDVLSANQDTSDPDFEALYKKQ